VVVIVQENRSFENFFAGYPGADAPTYGYAVGKQGRYKISLRGITFQGPDLEHDWNAAITDWDNGKMDGFNAYGRKFPHNGPNPAYTYVGRKWIVPYWTMAAQYVLADHMFPTE
jgi:phospholipase C